MERLWKRVAFLFLYFLPEVLTLYLFFLAPTVIVFIGFQLFLSVGSIAVSVGCVVAILAWFVFCLWLYEKDVPSVTEWRFGVMPALAGNRAETLFVDPSTVEATGKYGTMVILLYPDVAHCPVMHALLVVVFREAFASVRDLRLCIGQPESAGLKGARGIGAAVLVGLPDRLREKECIFTDSPVPATIARNSVLVWPSNTVWTSKEKDQRYTVAETTDLMRGLTDLVASIRRTDDVSKRQRRLVPAYAVVPPIRTTWQFIRHVLMRGVPSVSCAVGKPVVVTESNMAEAGSLFCTEMEIQKSRAIVDRKNASV